MQKELGTPGAIVGMLILGCLFGGLALAIYPGWPAIGVWLNKTEAPAWVQAVGSIAAIGATGWSVHHAHMLQERQRARVAGEQYAQLLESIFQLVGGLHQVMIKITKLSDANEDPLLAVDEIRKMHEELTGLRFALVQFDVTRLDRYGLIEAVLVARSVIAPFLRTLEKAMHWSNYEGNTQVAYFAAHARDVCGSLAPRAELLRLAADERRTS